MNKRIARELRNRLAPLAGVVVTFATITVVPATTEMIAAAHRAEAAWMDRAASKHLDRHPPMGSRYAGHYLATVYGLRTRQLAARTLASEIR
jgi:hypothetical protein